MCFCVRESVSICPNICQSVYNKLRGIKAVPNLFECALHVYPLVPGGGWVGQAVAGVAAAADVDLLTAEGAEGLGHHEDAVVRQRGGVLKRTNKEKEQMSVLTNLVKLFLLPAHRHFTPKIIKKIFESNTISHDLVPGLTA